MFSLEMFLPFLFTIGLFVTVVLMLSLGFIFAGKKIKGSCGGIAVYGSDGEPLSCDTCPNRNKNPNCEKAKKTA